MAKKTTPPTKPDPAKATPAVAAKPAKKIAVRTAPAEAPAPAPAAKPGKAAAKSAKAAAAKKGSAPAQTETPAPKPAIVTLKHLAAKLGRAHDLPPKQAQAMFDGVVGLLVEHLKAGDKLRLAGLGILEVKNRPARTGRNPATGAPVQIAASKKVAFRPAKDLKDAV
jgi:DNA-binding protein HU-beta